MQSLGFYLFLSQVCGVLVVEYSQSGNGFDVGLPGTFGQTTLEHSVVHFLA